jgi:hypothetical protein
MEIRRGAASKVRFSTQVRGTSGEHGGTVSTTFIAVFELEGVAVHARATRPPTLEERDEVIIAGAMDDGVFRARALRNVTRGTVDHEARGAGVIIGAVFCVMGMGVAAMAALLGSGSEKLFGLAGVVFAIAGVLMLRSFNRVRTAEADVLRAQ